MKIRKLLTLGAMLFACNTHSFASDADQTEIQRTFRSAFQEHLKGDLYEKQEQVEWFNNLDGGKENHIQQLYVQLDRGGELSEAHNKWLSKCVSDIYSRSELHKFNFPPVFLNFLSHMPAEDACATFDRLLGCVPKGMTSSGKWFDVVRDYVSQLPEEEHDARAAKVIMALHHVGVTDEGGYIDNENDEDKKLKLRGLRSALKARNEPITLKGLVDIYKADPALLDKFKYKTTNAAYSVGYGCFVAAMVPVMVYWFFTGQMFVH
jgi:hypothetical protein